CQRPNCLRLRRAHTREPRRDHFPMELHLWWINEFRSRIRQSFARLRFRWLGIRFAAPQPVGVYAGTKSPPLRDASRLPQQRASLLLGFRRRRQHDGLSQTQLRRERYSARSATRSLLQWNASVLRPVL